MGEKNEAQSSSSSSEYVNRAWGLGFIAHLRLHSLVCSLLESPHPDSQQLRLLCHGGDGSNKFFRPGSQPLKARQHSTRHANTVAYESQANMQARLMQSMKTTGL
jgi:hypothetical protein